MRGRILGAESALVRARSKSPVYDAAQADALTLTGGLCEGSGCDTPLWEQWGDRSAGPGFGGTIHSWFSCNERDCGRGHRRGGLHISTLPPVDPEHLAQAIQTNGIIAQSTKIYDRNGIPLYDFVDEETGLHESSEFERDVAARNQRDDRGGGL